MRVVLHVLNGPYTGRKIWLQPGQVAEIGSGADMDFSFPHDAQMTALHFDLVCGHQNCQVRTRGTKPTFINGEPIEDANVRHGDRLRAGSTDFGIQIDGASAAGSGSGESTADAEEGPPALLITPEFCERFSLSAAARTAAGTGMPVEEFLDLLLEKGAYGDALRTLANVLAKREAIWWACQCISGRKLPPTALAAWEAAVLWVRDPTDEHRRECMAVASRAGHHVPAAQIAMGVFFSGGSIAPVGLTDVAPDETITAHCIVGSLTSIAAQSLPQSMAEVQKAFIEIGRMVLKGQDLW